MISRGRCDELYGREIPDDQSTTAFNAPSPTHHKLHERRESQRLRYAVGAVGDHPLIDPF